MRTSLRDECCRWVSLTHIYNSPVLRVNACTCIPPWGHHAVFLYCTVPSHQGLIYLCFLNKPGLLIFSLQNYQVLRYHGDGENRKHQNRFCSLQLKCKFLVSHRKFSSDWLHSRSSSQRWLLWMNCTCDVKLSFASTDTKSKQRKKEAMGKEKENSV